MGKTTPELLGKAIAAVAGGQSQSSVSRQLGVPLSSLNDAYRRWLKGDTEDRRQLQDALVAQHVENAALAGQEIQRRLREAPEAFKSSELVAVHGMSTDKVALREGWSKGGDDAGNQRTSSALDRVLGKLAEHGGSVSIEVRPEPAAIDVTPTREPK